MCIRDRQSFVPRDAFVLEIQRELCHSKNTRKVSGLSRNGPQAPIVQSLDNAIQWINTTKTYWVIQSRHSTNSSMFSVFIITTGKDVFRSGWTLADIITKYVCSVHYVKKTVCISLTLVHSIQTVFPFQILYEYNDQSLVKQGTGFFFLYQLNSYNSRAF